MVTISLEDFGQGGGRGGGIRENVEAIRMNGIGSFNFVCHLKKAP